MLLLWLSNTYDTFPVREPYYIHSNIFGDVIRNDSDAPLTVTTRHFPRFIHLKGHCSSCVFGEWFAKLIPTLNKEGFAGDRVVHLFRDAPYSRWHFVHSLWAWQALPRHHSASSTRAAVLFHNFSLLGLLPSSSSPHWAGFTWGRYCRQRLGTSPARSVSF